jgi:hypothetical protein
VDRSEAEAVGDQDLLSSYREVIGTWEKAGYDLTQIEWWDYYPGEHFDIEVQHVFERMFNAKPRRVFVSKVMPGRMVPYHWDVEDKEKDDKLTTLKLIQADRPKDTKIEVVVNVDDIKRQAKENGVKEDVFLSQQIASVMSASYLMLDAIKDGKDPSKYLTNGEFLVASNLLADGMVRRTNKDAIPYLDQERANMAKRIEEEHGDVETAGSDAFERAEALGFKGINTGGWADKIVNGFGTTKDLDELDEVSEVDDDDEIDEVDDYDAYDDYDEDDTVLASNDDDDEDTKDTKDIGDIKNII